MYLTVQEPWISKKQFLGSRSWQEQKSMDLSNFCPRIKIKQYKVCPALNFVCSCPEGLDIKFFFSFGGHKWQQWKCMYSYIPHRTDKRDQCKHVQLWIGYVAALAGPGKVGSFWDPWHPVTHIKRFITLRNKGVYQKTLWNNAENHLKKPFTNII